MKRGTPGHPKTHALSAVLRVRRYAAIGLLESLWHFAALYAHQGDVGRHTDDAIARALDWEGDPRALVSALVETRWLDACPCHRLRIHDWPAHADQTVQRVLHNRKLAFLACYDDASIVLAPCYDHASQPLAVSREPLAGSRKPVTNGKQNRGIDRERVPERRSDPGLFGAPDGGAPPPERQSKVPDKRTEARTAARMATDGGETWPSAEAVDDWNDRYGAGTAPGGKITGPLTTLVRAQAKASGRLRANEWAVSVRPAWRRYLAESTHPAPNAEDFRQHFADWREGGRGAGGNGKPSSAQLYREACEALELRDAERGRGDVPAVDGGGRPALPSDRA